MGARRCLLAGLIATGAFGIPLFLTLWTSVPATATATIHGRAYDFIGVVPFQIPGHVESARDGTFFVHEIGLQSRHPERLFDHAQIALVFGDYNTEPRLYDAELRFAGTDCVYRTRAGAILRNDSRLTFYRRAGCVTGSRAATGFVVLRIRFTTQGMVGIWTVGKAPVDVPDEALVVARRDPPGEAAFVARGFVVDVFPDERETRVALLAYVWNVGGSALWLVAALAGCAVLVGIGAALLWCGPEATAWRRPAGAFATALALAASYALVVPPFQAADEPNHLVGLSGLLQRPALAAEAEALADRDHFEEIQFDKDRRFSPLDRLGPGIPWNDGIPPYAGRGAGAQVVWRVLAPFVRTLPVPRLLLAMRLAHALLFAASVALFVWLIRRAGNVTHPELVAAGILFVPALPYFGGYMSNYALLLDAYIVFAAGAAIALWNPGSRIAGAVAISGLACAMGLSRSAVPMTPLLAVVLAVRVTLADATDARQTAIYWLGVIPGALAAVAILRFVSPSQWSPAWFAMAVTGVLAGAVLERAVARLRAARRFMAGTGLTTRIIAIATACAIAAILGASLAVRYPPLMPLNPKAPPTVLRYAWDAVIACATFLRPGQPDTLSSLTFWVGFGWLEAMPPWPLVSLLGAASSVALVSLLIWIAVARAGRMLAAFGWIAAGFFASIAAYAFSVALVGLFDLHGRYLIGAYLTVLVVVWSGPARVAEAISARPRGWLRASVAAGGLAVHVYCLCYLLQRYF